MIWSLHCYTYVSKWLEVKHNLLALTLMILSYVWLSVKQGRYPWNAQICVENYPFYASKWLEVKHKVARTDTNWVRTHLSANTGDGACRRMPWETKKKKWRHSVPSCTQRKRAYGTLADFSLRSRAFEAWHHSTQRKNVCKDAWKFSTAMIGWQFLMMQWFHCYWGAFTPDAILSNIVRRNLRLSC